MGRELQIRVLGPVDVVGANGAPAPMERRLLAALAVEAGRACSADHLVEALWPGSAPRSAAKLLQVYVSRLRRALGAGAVETRTGGYALDTREVAVDAGRFERLLEDARRARAEGNAALAAALLGRAQALWRGPAYGGFAAEDFARAEAERLEEQRLAAVEERMDAELELGHHAERVAELLSLVAAQPLRERLRGQAMLALYRSGRHAEALDLYMDGLRHLREELGVDPGPELRELHRLIARQDPTLAVTASQPAEPSELPAPLTPLVGRRRELTELTGLLVRDGVRLLVLTGAGGSGKTRLALEAARAAAPSFANGAAFVELAPVRAPHLVIPALMRSLGVDEVPGREPLQTLAGALRPLERLVVADNFEHLLPAAPELARLLKLAPRLTLLVTSRAVLHVSGEHVYPVQPLEVGEAMTLFQMRAREAGAGLDAGASAEAIRGICVRLDGLPLAVELAAARTRTLAPEALLDRLETRLPLLTGGPRDLPARQRTLRATLDWSFGLLAPEERALAARLAVFVGSFDADAAAAVCDAGLDLLASLVDQSLLERTPDGRFAYLETVREFALEQLEATPDAARVRRRHLDHFARLADSADITAVRRLGRERLDVAAAAEDNVRAALAWALEAGEVALGLGLATAMERFWVTRDPREGMRWFETLLGSPEAEAVPAAQRAHALRAYASAADIAGEDELARRLYERSLELFDELGDREGRAVLLHRLGISALRRRDLAKARELVDASHRIHEEDGNRWGQAQTTGVLAAIERDLGNGPRAAELLELSATMARDCGVRWWESGMLAELANLALDADRVDEGEAAARQSLLLARQLGDRPGCVFGVGLMARVAALRGSSERATRLWGAVAAEDAVAPLGGWRRHRGDYLALLTELLGPAFEADPGQPPLPLDAAVALALEPAPAAALSSPPSR